MENQILTPKIVGPKEYGLDEKQAEEVEREFLPVISERENLSVEYTAIIGKEITPAVEREAHELRLKLTKVRTNTDRLHKAAKSFYLAGGRFVDAWKNKNNTIIEQMEDRLKEIETTSIRAEQCRINRIESERKAELSEFCEPETLPVGLGLMRDDIYLNYLTGVKVAFEAKKEAERKELEAKIERERITSLHISRKDSIIKLWQFVLPEYETINLGELSDSDFARFTQDLRDHKQKIDDENEKIRIENGRLQEEAERKEREFEAERKRQSDLLAKQKADADEKARIEREKQDKILADIEAKAKIERDKAEAERKRLVSVLIAKQEAERKAKEETDIKEAERIAAEKKAAKAPDKERLTLWVDSMLITGIGAENMSKKSIDVANSIFAKFSAFKSWAKSEIEKL